MTERVVVCFRALEAVVAPTEHLAFARVMTDRAAAHGGRLIAWGATAIAFELDPDALQDVIDLALSVVRDAPQGREPSVGISEGPLERIEETTARIDLAWGAPLVRATALARAARPGEVLVDPLMGSVKRGELLTQGSRVGIHGRDRVRGLLLDIAHPFRTGGARGVSRSEFIGRTELGKFDIPGGSLAIVRAGRGHGGSRFFEELEQRLEPARVLDISPHPFGEPLGALRRALLRAVTMGQAPLNLTAPAGVGLDGLLAGEGLDPDSAAELLVSWLTPDSVQDPRGVVLLDDASEIDADTLEVVARAAVTSGEPFRVMARLGESEPLPDALGGLPRSCEVFLGPLSHEEAVRLAVASTRGALDETSAARWADRGRRLPLGIVETIRGSMEAGEIVWEDGRAIARLQAAGAESANGAKGANGTKGVGTPKHWVKRRLEEQSEDGRLILAGLSVLGGQAESRDLGELLRRKAGAAFDPSGGLAVLQAAGWVVRLKPDVVALPSATHRDAVLSTLSDVEFRTWHRAASESFRARERPLSMAAATVHAILAGDSVQAAEIARSAAAAIRAVGLEVTARAFERYAESADVAALAARNLFTAQLEMARAAPSIWPSVRESLPPQVPARVAITVPPSSHVSIVEAPQKSVPPPKPSRKPPLPPRRSARPVPQTAPSALAAPGAPEPSSGGPPRSAATSDGDPPSAAVDAFRKGDLEAVERMAAHVRLDEGRTGLAERLQAMAQLARGATGDAIRSLRDAAEVARRTASRDRCRTALALAVALGAAGRYEEALIEALDALARARELADDRGERACLRFLSHLAGTAGHHDVAEAWAAPAEG